MFLWGKRFRFKRTVGFIVTINWTYNERGGLLEKRPRRNLLI